MQPAPDLTTPLLAAMQPQPQPPHQGSEEPLATQSRTVSRMLEWLGPWSVYALVTIIPLAFIIVIYGVIPLGNPESTHFSEQAVRTASPLPASCAQRTVGASVRGDAGALHGPRLRLLLRLLRRHQRAQTLPCFRMR